MRVIDHIALRKRRGGARHSSPLREALRATATRETNGPIERADLDSG